MKKIMLITDGEGRYGHAIEKVNERHGNKYLEIRFLDDYDVVHTTNHASFLIYYEVCNEIEGD
tara:strand:+ start:358 stop:546 length:189 start_codon:yes stop_codon:yes gene_type:complete